MTPESMPEDTLLALAKRVTVNRLRAIEYWTTQKQEWRNEKLYADLCAYIAELRDGALARTAVRKKRTLRFNRARHHIQAVSRLLTLLEAARSELGNTKEIRDFLEDIPTHAKNEVRGEVIPLER